MKNYSANKTGYEHLNTEEYQNIPNNVIDDKMYLAKMSFASIIDFPHYNNLPIEQPENAKHGSFTTIFSVWNSMVGTGLVTIPWAYSESGLLLGICKLLVF